MILLRWLLVLIFRPLETYPTRPASITVYETGEEYARAVAAGEVRR